MKYLTKAIDWLYYLSLELFTSAHVDKGRGINHFNDDKYAHILTGCTILPWILSCIFVVSHIVCPHFNLRSNDNPLQILTIIVSILIGIFIIKRYDNAPSLLFEHHKRKFDEWKLPKQIFMMLLPVLLCLASWWFTFTIFNLFY
ncbi:MAG: hypothetical protein MJZ32_00205 [Bacteroidaceae bacterium]|nr:hypothetical protein [Bacteroidaceae bacterium]